MVSGRAKGNYALYIVNTMGQRKLVKSADANFWNCSGLGSSEGVWSTTATPEKLSYLPLSADTGASGYCIECVYTASAATTLDASDCVGMIPVLVNGQAQTIGLNGGNGIGNDNFTSEIALADSAYVANQPTTAWKIRAKEGTIFKVGGDKVFMSLEDNA